MRIRPGSVRDFPVFARLLNEHNQWLRGEVLWQEDELAATLISATGAPVDNDRYIEVDGIPVAAIHTHVTEPYTKGTLTLAAPPHDQRPTCVRMLLDAGERIVNSRPEIVGSPVLEVSAPAEDQALQQVLEAAGYRRAYTMTTMEADVFDAPAATPPADVTISTFSLTRDLDDGYQVIKEAFPPDLGSWHLSRRDYEYVQRNDPTALPGLSVIARDAQGPVALALNYLDTMQDASGFIGSLAVLPRRRREGVGTAVALESFERFRSRGWHHARLTSIFDIDAGEQAYRFYSGVGMRPIFDDVVFRKVPA